MKTTTIAAAMAAILTLATVAVACGPVCPCGVWGDWKIGRCGPKDDCCQQALIWHRHGSRVCPPIPTPTPTPTPATDSFKPFTVWGNDACPDPMSGPVVAVSSRHDIPFVVLIGRYDSRFDELTMSTYHGEWLTDGFYNPVIACDRGYGGMPIVSRANPQRAVYFRAAKSSRTDDALPMTVTLTDNEGAVLYSVTTTARTVEGTVVLVR